MTSSILASPVRPVRLKSLDQFRGYTMAGMLLVNFLGSYAVCPRILKHTNDYCSYADTIMPQFLFAAGFAMRLSLGKRLEAGGRMPWGRAIRRILGLALIAIVWYGFCDLNAVIDKLRRVPLDMALVILFKRDFFQTLLHIAATSLWILPVIAASSKVRLGFAVVSGLLHVAISWWFNFDWIHAEPSGIDGGPLGFLSWSIPALSGSLACDAVRASGPKSALRIAGIGFIVMLFGWSMSIGTTLYDVHADQSQGDSVFHDATHVHSKPTLDPKDGPFPPDPVIPTSQRLRSWDRSIVELPFVPPPDAKHRKLNYWMMSQRFGTISYLTFSAGLCLVVYALFLWGCDTMNWQLGFFRTLGTNSLAAYILHDIAGWVLPVIFTRAGVPFFDVRSMSIPYTAASFLCFTLFVYVFCRLLEKLGWFIRV